MENRIILNVICDEKLPKNTICIPKRLDSIDKNKLILSRGIVISYSNMISASSLNITYHELEDNNSFISPDLMSLIGFDIQGDIMYLIVNTDIIKRYTCSCGFCNYSYDQFKYLPTDYICSLCKTYIK